MGNMEELKLCKNLSLGEVEVAKGVELCHNIKSSTSWEETHGIIGIV